jgi:hypothetical protein
MHPDRAAELCSAWVARHREEDMPTPDARAAVERLMTERVPEPRNACALNDVEGRRRIAILAGPALFLVWAVPAGAGTREAARCRRVPLAHDRTTIEVSDRLEDRGPVRHWWFELDDEPLVFRAARPEEEAFARALASALGWPAPVL